MTRIARLLAAGLLLAPVAAAATPGLPGLLIPSEGRPYNLQEIEVLRYRLEAALKTFAYDPNTADNRRWAVWSVEDMLAHHEAVREFTVEAGDEINRDRNEMMVRIRVRFTDGGSAIFPCRVQMATRSVSC